jgi:hypothetical protein
MTRKLQILGLCLVGAESRPHNTPSENSADCGHDERRAFGCNKVHHPQFLGRAEQHLCPVAKPGTNSRF